MSATSIDARRETSQDGRTRNSGVDMTVSALPCHLPKQRGDTPGVIAPPPLIFASALMAGLVLNVVLPPLPLSASVATVGALVLGACGVALAVSFFRAFRRAGTPVDPGQSTTALVTTGPYRLTRNPAYLAMACGYLAITVALASLGAAVLLVPTLYLIDCGVVQREERYLDDRFGEEYARYRSVVRRWL